MIRYDRDTTIDVPIWIQALVIIVMFGIGWWWISGIPETTAYTSVYSIGDGTQIHGSFALGGGYINQESMYFYYTPAVRGGLIKCSVPQDETVVFMDTPTNPYIKAYSWMGFARGYDLHVPPGTIIQQYSLGVNN